MLRFLPQVMLATLAVAVVPVAVGWWLRADGVISSRWACAAVAIGLSLALSAAGSACWKRRHSAADVLFSELLIWGWLRRYRLERRIARATNRLGLAPELRRPGAQAGDVQRRAQLLRDLENALEASDPYLSGHSRRVARYATGVARTMGLSPEEVSRLRFAAAIHDIGKLEVPIGLVRKRGPLTDAEFDVVMRHAEAGAEMVECLGDPELTAIVRHRHERFDGLGYPEGLIGEEIPLGARILAVADTFDAIASARPHRAPARLKQAIRDLIANSGSQLDPVVVREFLRYRYYTGRPTTILGVTLGLSPQRALAWLRGGGGAAVRVPVADLAVSALGRMAIYAAAVGTTVGVGVARYETRLLPRSSSLHVASGAPFSSQFSGQSSGAGLRVAKLGAPPGGALGSVVRLSSIGLLNSLQGLTGGAGARPRAGAGLPARRADAGSRMGGNGGSAGGGNGGSAGGGNGGSGLRTGVTPTGRTGGSGRWGSSHHGTGSPAGSTPAPSFPATSTSPASTTTVASTPVPSATANPAPGGAGGGVSSAPSGSNPSPAGGNQGNSGSGKNPKPGKGSPGPGKGGRGNGRGSGSVSDPGD